MSVPSRIYLFRRCNSISDIGYWQEGCKRRNLTRSWIKSDALKSLTRFKDLFSKEPVLSSFSAFIQDFHHQAESTYKPKTIEQYDRSLRQLFSLLGEVSLCSVSRKHVDTYEAARWPGAPGLGDAPAEPTGRL